MIFESFRADLRGHRGRWGAQGLWALTIYRFGRRCMALRSRWLRKPLSVVYNVLYKLVQILTGIELPREAEIGPGFVIDHSGGIVISGYAKFGAHCRIRSGVVVGLARVDEPCAPVIGNHVDIGTGAVLLGRITVGDHSLIGANAVVVKDVPPWSIAVGVPAVVRPRKDRPQAAGADPASAGAGPADPADPET